MTARAALIGQHWELFEAWCEAEDLQALPASADTVDAFLVAFPGSKSRQRLRRQAIATAHERAGEASPIVPPDTHTVWRADLELADVEHALAEIPKYRHPVGLRGRRDAFLVVLVGYLRLSREQARAVDVSDVELTSIVKVRGRVIPMGEDPVTCLACAVTRWLRVAGNAYRGFRAETRTLLDPTKADLAVHDCSRTVTEPWRTAEQLLLPLDTYGWARTGVPLSKRSITTIVPARRAAAPGFVETVGPSSRKPSRFDDLSVAETYKAAGELEMRAAAAAARAAEVLAEAHRLGLELGDLLVPVPDDDEQNTW